METQTKQAGVTGLNRDVAGHVDADGERRLVIAAVLRPATAKASLQVRAKEVHA